MADDIKLPALPYPADYACVANACQPIYTAEQMQTYGLGCVLADREGHRGTPAAGERWLIQNQGATTCWDGVVLEVVGEAARIKGAGSYWQPEGAWYPLDGLRFVQRLSGAQRAKGDSHA